jgi:cytochrome c oxidase accessory protein FixG
MFDKDTLIITYDTARGDPRGSRARKAEPRSLGLGDCIDCGICVEVCPTGIDIRKGLQYECIGCAACIDGCNQIMDRMGYAPGLIRYSTQNAVREGWSREQILRRVMRPRTLIYASILFVLAAVLVTALAMRVPLRVDVLRDRIALGRVLDGGVVENVYRLQIMNTAERPHVFRVGVEGLPGVEITSAREVSVGPASLHTLVTTVHVPPGADVGSRPIRFTIQAIDRPSVKVTERSIFRVPQ